MFSLTLTMTVTSLLFVSVVTLGTRLLHSVSSIPRSPTTLEALPTRVYQGSQSTPDYWKLPPRAISLDGNIIFSDFAQSRVPGSPTPIAVLDSSTTFILGPSADVAAFWEIVGGARKGNELWQIKCNRAVLVGFVLGDASATGEYMVDPANASWRADDKGDGWCTGGIQESNSVRFKL